MESVSGGTASVFLLRVRHDEFNVLRIRLTFGLTDEIHCSELKIIHLIKMRLLLISIYDLNKYNHRREGIRVANARPKVIIFCKS